MSAISMGSDGRQQTELHSTDHELLTSDIVGGSIVKSKYVRLLNRREFNGLCMALSPLVASSSASAFDAATGVASTSAERTVAFRDGTVVPALGQGCSWHRDPAPGDEEALRAGLSLGMTLIDTAEGYSNGRSEELIGRAIAGQRDRVFLVSKVDHMTTGDAIARACAASLARLGTEHLDLYLAHWRDRGADLSVIVTAFENLRTAGKIRAWGVSNFSVSDMEELFHIPHGDRCATNQVRYNLNDRSIEHDLLPWCEQHGMPVMAYSPFGGPGAGLLRDPVLASIGSARNCPPTAIALAWTIRNGNVIAIPEAGSVVHVRENAVAFSLTLTQQELQKLDAAHPPLAH